MEYDAATFASYINTLHRQFVVAQKFATGPARHIHDYFNAKAAALLVEASQARVSRKSLRMDNSPDPDEHHNGLSDDDPAHGGVDSRERGEFEDEEDAMRDVRMSGNPEDDEADDQIMHSFATQSQLVPPSQSDQEAYEDEEDDALVEVGEGEEPRERNEGSAAPPPVFTPITFDLEAHLAKSVKRRLRKGHEPILEEQPKWSLLAKVLKEIEDTIARVEESHKGEPILPIT